MSASVSASPSQYSKSLPEVVISAACPTGNVVALSNPTLTGVSGLTFRDNTNSEKAGIGVGNAGSGFWADLAFLEISNQTGMPQDFAIVLTTKQENQRILSIAGITGTATFTPKSGPNPATRFLTDGQVNGTISLQDKTNSSAPGVQILDNEGHEKVSFGYANTAYGKPDLAGNGYVEFPGTFAFHNTGSGEDYPLLVNGNGIVIASMPPSSASAEGVAGQISWDANYIYVCIGKNTWKRAALTGWDTPLFSQFNAVASAHHRSILLLLFFMTSLCVLSMVVSIACLLKLKSH